MAAAHDNDPPCSHDKPAHNASEVIAPEDGIGVPQLLLERAEEGTFGANLPAGSSGGTTSCEAFELPADIKKSFHAN